MLTLPPSRYSAVSLLAAGAKTDSAAATSAWTAISVYDGPITFVAQVGTVTAGSIAAKIRTATDDSGSNAADAHSFTTVTTANDPLTQMCVLDSANLKGYVQYTGTVTTGPADVAVAMLVCNQYA